MTIESDIVAWGSTRPGWQQTILMALADGQDYDSEAIEHIVDEITAGSSSTPTIENLAVKSAVVEQVSLTAVTDLQGVNALMGGQHLYFASTGITVIYGDNGSGKSGYARLIKAMVNARHRSEILPNVFENAPVSPSGTLCYTVAGVEQTLIFPGVPPTQLLKMRFYDEHCGDEYLTKESSITYRPSALTLLDGLIRVCDSVRSELAARIKSNEADALSLELPPGTPSADFVSSISDATTSDQIESNTKLPDGTTQLLAAALGEEARLTASNPQEEKTRLAKLAQQAELLGTELLHLLNLLGVEQTKTRIKLRDSARTARAAASVSANRSFDDEPLEGVGSETWRALWAAARNYSVGEAYHDHEFPFTGEDAVCVLCQQPLSDSAEDRLKRFERYMTDTTERDADIAEKTFTTTVNELRALQFSTGSRTVALAAMESHDEGLAAEARELLAATEVRRDALVDLLEGPESGATLPEALSADVPSRLMALAEQLTALSAETDLAQFTTALSAAKATRLKLQAQVHLSEAKDKLIDEVERRISLAKLKKARTAADTSSITQKAAALTREYATDRILDQFTRETDRLRLQRVTLEDLGGRKGQLNQRPGLLGAAKGAGARSVLSEGEQTALGLAGFFTEAEFDDSRSAVIFDDPVTSLDHVRRDTVARRLAQLAHDRQVVVFTHDVAFTGDLSSAAESEGVPLAERAIQRRGTEPGMCVEGFPWKAKDFASRIDHLRTELARLNKDRATLVQDEWENRVAEWAGYLSETWERSVTTEVLNQVFDRGSSQVSMRKFRVLAEITPADDQDLQDGYGATSRWGRRHDKAVETNYVAPEPAELEREFQRLIDWQKRVKKYRG